MEHEVKNDITRITVATKKWTKGAIGKKLFYSKKSSIHVKTPIYTAKRTYYIQIDGKRHDIGS